MIGAYLEQNQGQVPNAGMRHAMFQAPAGCGGVDAGAFIADPRTINNKRFISSSNSKCYKSKNESKCIKQNWSKHIKMGHK